MLATPFKEDESLDTGSIPNLMDRAKQSGCRGVVCLGVTGEVARMTDRERSLVVKAVVENADVIPVTVGTTAAGTAAAVENSLEAERLGAAAVMVSAPVMGKPNDNALFTHYARIADAVSIPIVVQDYPRTSGVNMSPEFIARLAENIPAAQYLKLEDPPTPPKISAIRKLIGDKMGIFGGLGGVFLLEELARGSAGAMTGFAYPEMMVQVVELCLKGDQDRAEDIFDAYLPLVRYEQQLGLGLAIRKETLRRRGVIASAKLRAPGPSMTPADHDDLTRLVKRLEKRLEELG